MTKPSGVFEAMCRAHYLIPAAYDGLPEYEKAGIRVIVKAALRAARELGYELKPRLRTVAMTDAYYEAGDDDELQWQNQYDAAPDILAEGE